LSPPRSLTATRAGPHDSPNGFIDEGLDTGKGNLAAEIAGAAVEMEGMSGVWSFREGYVPAKIARLIELDGVDMTFREGPELAGHPAANFTVADADVDLIVSDQPLTQEDAASRRRYELCMRVGKEAAAKQVQAGGRHGCTELKTARNVAVALTAASAL
jgi:hypothetical protein